MGRSEVPTNVTKWCEGLWNGVFIIIGRYTDHMKFYFLFHILLVLLCIIVYMVVRFACFYFILRIMYSYCSVYVFVLLCMFFSRYCVSLCCSVYCLCVNVYCTAATGSQPNCSCPVCHKSHVSTSSLNNTRTNSEVNENSNCKRYEVLSWWT